MIFFLYVLFFTDMCMFKRVFTYMVESYDPICDPTIYDFAPFLRSHIKSRFSQHWSMVIQFKGAQGPNRQKDLTKQLLGWPFNISTENRPLAEYLSQKHASILVVTSCVVGLSFSNMNSLIVKGVMQSINATNIKSSFRVYVN